MKNHYIQTTLRILTLLAVLPAISAAFERVAEPQIIVSPDKPDWTAKTGEKVTFTVRIFRDHQPMNGVPIEYTAGEEKKTGQSGTGTVNNKGMVIPAGTLDKPGFLRCTVKATIDGNQLESIATVAFEPENIQPTQINPDDFDEFWDQGKRELAEIPLKAQMTLLPDRCTDSVNVYHVNFQSWTTSWNTARIYGIYAEPKEPGKYPALLRVPGAGVRPYGGEIELAENGLITLQIGIHGIPVTEDIEIYDGLRHAALHYYPYFNLDDRNSYFYRRVYLACIRANDFLTTRDNWNRENLIVTGGSQGGQLSIVTAALDDRVTGLAAAYPAYCDVTGYLHDRAGGWPHMFRWDKDGFHETDQKIKTTQYYDTVNFAKRLEVPGIYTLGFNDETCPPTSIFAAYNSISAPKQLVLALNTGHRQISAQRSALREWILEQTGIQP